MIPSKMLDTNICIYIAKQKPIHILHQFEQHTHQEIVMSSVTYGELMFGVEKSGHRQKTFTLDVQDMTKDKRILDWRSEQISGYGKQ